jgi:hypothetical protein
MSHSPYKTMSSPTLGSAQSFWDNSSDEVARTAGSEVRPVNTAIRIWRKTKDEDPNSN